MNVTRDGSTFRTMMGIDPERAATFMQESGADVVALNCGTGMDMERGARGPGPLPPRHRLPVMVQPNARSMSIPVPQLSATTSAPLSCIKVAARSVDAHHGAERGSVAGHIIRHGADHAGRAGFAAASMPISSSSSDVWVSMMMASALRRRVRGLLGERIADVGFGEIAVGFRGDRRTVR